MLGSGLLAKVSGLRSAARVGVAATAAALTMTAAVAAAVVLPAGGGDSGSDVLQSATVEGGGTVHPDSSTPSAPAEVKTGADAGALVVAPAGSAPITADVTAGAGTAVTTPSIPLPSIPVPSLPTSIPVPDGALPDLSLLADIPTKVMACLAPVFELVSSMPAMPSPQQLMQIGPSIVSCVTAIVADLPLPFGMNACISTVMGFVSDVTANLPGGIPDFGGLDVAACIPSGLPVPTGLSAWSSFMGGGFPFGR